MTTFTYSVLPSDDGTQIKRIIRGRMGVSYKQFSLVKAAGGMLLDGVSVHANAVVRAGQTVSITLVEKSSKAEASTCADVDIVYEDEDLFIINKPAPLACQSSRSKDTDALENRLRAHLGDPDDFVFRPVNRLDKGTSGLMVAAKNAHAQLLLSRRLHTGDFIREYLAVVVGVPSPESGRIDAPIRKCDGATVKRGVFPDGKPAVTEYRLEKTNGETSLVRLRLLTGRTHQIRVHMAHIGCPVFGDFLYGIEDERLKGRFALHSAYVSVVSPSTGETLQFTAPMKDDLNRLI